MNDICVVFDLDDTLYKEIDFVRSGFRYIVEHLQQDVTASERMYKQMFASFSEGKDAFDIVCTKFGEIIDKKVLLSWYRFHLPSLNLNKETESLLSQLDAKGAKLGIISDGRSITQRNKIKALGLERYFAKDAIIISEEFGSSKPSKRNYSYFQKYYPESKRYVYIGDNPSKDFIAPNSLGWLTIGLLDNGENIHPQAHEDLIRKPKIWINCISDIWEYI